MKKFNIIMTIIFLFVLCCSSVKAETTSFTLSPELLFLFLGIILFIVGMISYFWALNIISSVCFILALFEGKSIYGTPFVIIMTGLALLSLVVAYFIMREE